MIYYIGYYNCDHIRHEERVVSPAAENKMGYIISALCEAYDQSIEVVSPASTKQNKFVKGKKQKIHDRVFLKTFSSFSSKIRLFRVIGYIFTKINFILYLMRNISSNDHVVVYHSLAYMRIIKWLKRTKGCKLTIEVEELYADVNCDEKLRKKEISYLKIADNYIFITELLREQVNTDKKYIISHGTYRTIPKSGKKLNDDKIHVVYAGSFNPIKGGACSAIEAAEFLSDKFVMHILGKGTESETKNVIKKIEEVSKKSQCEIVFDGYKTGKEFDMFIQSCHVGLSTQQPDGKYNASSFPSKVLMYMSNGLRVVSVRIPAVETSAVGEYIYYYDSQSAESVAKAIKNVSLNDEYDSRKQLDCLHKKFVIEFEKLLLE